MDNKSATVNDALQLLEATKAKLKPTKSPYDLELIQPVIDREMSVIAYNLKVLDSLIYISGNEKARLDFEYKKASHAATLRWTIEKLAEATVVKSDKFKLIKNELAQEQRDLDEMAAKYMYFRGLKETFMEWINVYKKARTIE